MNTRSDLHPKPKRFERILYTAAALILAALVLDGIFGPHGFIASYRLRLQVRQVQRKTEQLNRENQGFAKQAQQLKSDPSAIERVARERMGLVKPGELVFKLPPKPPSSPAASAPAKASDRASSNGSVPGN
ncbi:MAG TPA: septum formation initiator family protein [Patescibacteria group bacterium]|nr:septum formation initiator family protein [Patescibacteria group bacterium]